MKTAKQSEVRKALEMLSRDLLGKTMTAADKARFDGAWKKNARPRSRDTKTGNLDASPR